MSRISDQDTCRLLIYSGVLSYRESRFTPVRGELPDWTTLLAACTRFTTEKV